MTWNDRLTLSLLSGTYAACRLEPGEPVPAWAASGPWISITRTREELSIICPEEDVPGSVLCRRGWRVFKFEGPFDFSAVGVLVAVADPLAEAGVSILAVATYDTDYILIQDSQLEKTLRVLESRGHTVRR